MKLLTFFGWQKVGILKYKGWHFVANPYNSFIMNI